MALSEPALVSLLSLFDSEDETVAVDWIVKALRKPSRGGYAHPERIVRDALDEGVLYVDSIAGDGATFVGLTKQGERDWHDAFSQE